MEHPLYAETRFAGTALVPVFFWGILILVLKRNLRLRVVPALTITILPIITAGALFLRTYIISGSIHGIPLPTPGRSYFEAFTGTLKMTLLQFGFSGSFTSMIAVIAVLLITYIVLNASLRKELSKYIGLGLDLIIVFILSHTAIITHAMATSQTVFEPRYMSPLVPFMFILSVLVIGALWETARLRGFTPLSICGIVLSLAILFAGNTYKTFMNSEALFSKRTGHDRILNSATYQWLKANYSDDERITTNRPFHLSFFGGYSTIRLPHRRFNENYRLPDNMEAFLPDRMKHFGSPVIALFEQADETHEGEFIAELFINRKDNGDFVLLHSDLDGVVYRLKE
jgi:hypothetical protein